MANTKYVLNREVTTKECHWLSSGFKKGDVVYPFDGQTFGCISPGGAAFSMKEGEGPFFQLPRDAVDLVPTA